MQRRSLAILGSTGSIGQSAIAVARELADTYRVSSLAAHSSWKTLAEQVRQVRPDAVALADSDAAEKFRDAADTDPGEAVASD